MKKGWLGIQSYADKYGLSYHQAYRLIQNAQMKNKMVKGVRFLEDVPPPQHSQQGTSSTLQELKAKKLEQEIAKLQSQTQKHDDEVTQRAIRQHHDAIVNEVSRAFEGIITAEIGKGAWQKIQTKIQALLKANGQY